MSPLTKAFVVLVTLFSVVLVTLSVSNAAQTPNYREQALDYKRERDAARTAKAAMESRLAADLAAAQTAGKDAADELAQVRAQHAETQESYHGAQRELAQRIARIGQLTALSENLSATNQAQTARLGDQDGQIRELLTSLSEQVSRYTALAQQVNVIDGERQRYAVEIRRLREQLVALEVLSEEQASLLQQIEDAMGEDLATARPTPGNINGSVVSVEDIGRGITLVQVNLGTSDHVAAGMEFTVFRGDEYLGTIQINNVDVNTAVGQVTQAQGAMQPGDGVKSGQ